MAEALRLFFLAFYAIGVVVLVLRVLLLALALVFGVLLTEFRNFPAPIAILEPCVDIVPIAGRKVVLGPGRDTNEVPAVVGSEVPRPASVR